MSKNDTVIKFVKFHVQACGRNKNELLSPDKELWYKAPVQDKSDIISEPILILPEKSEKEIELEPLAKSESE